MTRRAILLLLLLAGGAIVNVAVALGSGARMRLPGFHNLNWDEAERLWWMHARVRPSRDVIAVRESGTFCTATWLGTNFFPTSIGTGIGGFQDPSPRAYDILLFDLGWPAQSVCLVRFNVVSRAVFPGRAMPISDYVRWMSEAKPRWPGFAINSVFYAFVLWLLFAAPFALRRRWRIKRGLCPKCGYPAGTSDVCTECGAAVASRIA